MHYTCTNGRFKLLHFAKDPHHGLTECHYLLWKLQRIILLFKYDQWENTFKQISAQSYGHAF